MSWVWTKMDKTGKSFEYLLESVKSLPAGQLFRHNQAGDLPGVNNSIDFSMLNKLVNASKGKRGFTYTHKPVLTNKKNAAAIKKANKNGFTINLSANSPDEVDALLNLKIGPVVTIAPINCEKTFYTKGGNKIIQCPATYKEGVTCSTCKLCAVSNRSVSIAFPVHGIKKNLLNNQFVKTA